MAHSNDPDYALLQRIAQGDEDAFQALYARHGLALLNYLLQIIGERQRAEDVLQEVMLIVWQKAAAYQPTGAVRGWMFGIARRQALKAQRGKVENLPLHEEQIATEGSLSEGVAWRLALRDAIQDLPAVEQEALEMVYYRGLTLDEVAARLDVPLNTVKTRLYRARKRLRHCLTEEAPNHEPQS